MVAFGHWQAEQRSPWKTDAQSASDEHDWSYWLAEIVCGVQLEPASTSPQAPSKHIPLPMSQNGAAIGQGPGQQVVVICPPMHCCTVDKHPPVPAQVSSLHTQTPFSHTACPLR
jgi:hypothetical protein